VPSHLGDSRLFDFTGLEQGKGSAADGVDGDEDFVMPDSIRRNNSH
jgi:hypothetical protein